nr:PAS domain-containing protein [Thioalkalivibrio sp.]
MVDPQKGNVVGANSAASRFLGCSAEELASLSPAELHPHEMPRLDAFLFTVQQQGCWIADDLSCRAKDGGLLPAQVRVRLSWGSSM